MRLIVDAVDEDHMHNYHFQSVMDVKLDKICHAIHCRILSSLTHERLNKFEMGEIIS